MCASKYNSIEDFIFITKNHNNKNTFQFTNRYYYKITGFKFTSLVLKRTIDNPFSHFAKWRGILTVDDDDWSIGLVNMYFGSYG